MNNYSILKLANKIIKTGSKSFSSAIKLFDPVVRYKILMLYAWCRYCDDVIDNQICGNKSKSLQKKKKNNIKYKLKILRIKTKKACIGFKMKEPAFLALQKIISISNFPVNLLFEHLDGFEMDATKRSYITLDETLDYCYHVAGTIGLIIAHLIGVKEKNTLNCARNLGIAFQLTNISRDIIDDFYIDRCYLPLNWLKNEGLNKLNFTLIENRKKLFKIVTRILDVAEFYYSSSLVKLNTLPLRSTLAIVTAWSIYREIGIKIRKYKHKAWNKRQYIKFHEIVKIFLTISWKIIIFRITTKLNIIIKKIFLTFFLKYVKIIIKIIKFKNKK
ncbi:phytoene synthase (plasmid) [Candidatus Profftella armatura (Diaphorina cf. continua)]|uniref:Phytoene synthase n=1 Tax=Candidatus Profftella armatura (Diaphorina cf. continua) TaxID=2661583 RepID=A0A7R7ACE3_9PROT|nr:phytoene/squalene synthase family protein [Candidatus Profftella armatura (Diaphorina cf. continua)]BCG49785.1 phytoene synthase [Candidatus Profftella armatura (Diaphorina cf. continua)]